MLLLCGFLAKKLSLISLKFRIIFQTCIDSILLIFNHPLTRVFLLIFCLIQHFNINLLSILSEEVCIISCKSCTRRRRCFIYLWCWINILNTELSCTLNRRIRFSNLWLWTWLLILYECSLNTYTKINETDIYI